MGNCWCLRAALKNLKMIGGTEGGGQERGGGGFLFAAKREGGKLPGAGKEEAALESSIMANGDDGCCLKEVLVTFQSCLNDQQEILMDPYIAGWKGLVRFLNTLGTIFSFVSKDAVAKIQIMENYRSSNEKAQYLTLQSMVKYELGNNMVDLKSPVDQPPSGCRTILRLHRALRWLQLFLEGLRTSSEDSSTSALCADAYNASLANYHPWIIRKTALLSFYVLPARNAFLELMNVGTPADAVAMLEEALPSIAKVYDITEALYAQHKLLEIP
ncbi:ceramide-1-phosphate transfer protein [Heteronotia binoei]|uniref:ceramide-1-phosphate transfer protein n=1 Tax=Heteronotia binoei TaxID=13085 RepID=UPI00292FEA5F|nr:ceramide-1-phosphate transfer protein [Heteronotia binoei]